MTNKEIIAKVRNFVEEECKKSTSKYGYEPFIFHFTPVRNYSVQLALKLKANLEIVEISAWLHDIGSIVYGRGDHHLTGARIAERKLTELNYPREKIEKIKECILNHRGSVAGKRNSLESQIIADADAMANFDNIPGIFKAALVYERLDQGQARKAVLKKLINSYNKLSKEAKKIIKPKYGAAMLLFK